MPLDCDGMGPPPRPRAELLPRRPPRAAACITRILSMSSLTRKTDLSDISAVSNVREMPHAMRADR